MIKRVVIEKEFGYLKRYLKLKRDFVGYSELTSADSMPDQKCFSGLKNICLMY